MLVTPSCATKWERGQYEGHQQHSNSRTDLYLVELSVVHECRGGDQPVLLVHAHLIHLFIHDVGPEGLCRVDGVPEGPLVALLTHGDLNVIAQHLGRKDRCDTAQRHRLP